MTKQSVATWLGKHGFGLGALVVAVATSLGAQVITPQNRLTSVERRVDSLVRLTARRDTALAQLGADLDARLRALAVDVKISQKIACLQVSARDLALLEVACPDFDRLRRQARQ